VRDIFSIIAHGVGVDARFSLGEDVLGWRQSKTTGETLREEVVVKLFARANNGILAGTDPELDSMKTGNNSEMKKPVAERNLNRMAKVHDFLEMRQCSQNLRATQKESRAQNNQMTAIGYISDTEEIVKYPGHSFNMMVRLYLNCQNDHTCHHLCLQMNLPGGRTQILNVRRIRRINRHQVESDEDSAPAGISDTHD